MKNIKKNRDTKRSKGSGRQGSFFSDLMNSASAKERKTDVVVVDFDDVYKLNKPEEETEKKPKRKTRKALAKDDKSTTSQQTNFSFGLFGDKSTYSDTNIEAVFGRGQPEEFSYDNPLAQEVVYDVISSGGGVMKVARKLFLLEQMRNKAPEEKATETVQEEAKPEKKERKKSRRTTRKHRDTTILEGVVAKLPKKLSNIAKTMGSNGYWRLKQLSNVELSLYTKLNTLKQVSSLIKSLHDENRPHGSITLESILINYNYEIFLEKSSLHEEVAAGTVNLDLNKKFDMLSYGIAILELMVGEEFSESDFPKLYELKEKEKGKKNEKGEENEDEDMENEEDYDIKMLLSQEIETEIRTAFKSIICVETVVELCIQLCSPDLESRPMAEDAYPWINESCKEVVKNDLTDKTLAVITSIFTTISEEKQMMKEVVIDPEIEDVDYEQDQDEEDEEESGKASIITNDSYQPPVTEEVKQETDEDIKKRRKSAKLEAFLSNSGNNTTEEDEKARSVSETKNEESTVENDERRTLDPEYLKAKGRIIKDQTVEEILEEDQFEKFKEAMRAQKQALSTINLPGPDELATRFRKQVRLRIDQALAIIKEARGIMTEEPNLVQLDGPVMVVGDIHGQFFDLINLLRIGGEPGSVLRVDKNGVEKRRQYLFLGDYVDRGDFQCEVLLYLLSLKIKYPEYVWLLRGNHECRTVAAYFGFKDECSKKYGLPLFNYAAETFQTMPIAATINTSGGKFLCLHGGISPNVTSLRQFIEFDRFTEPAMTGFLCDVLWADPIKDDFEDGEGTSLSEFLSLDYLPNPARGCSFRYGFRALVQFLAVNGLVGIIRAHEVQEEGYLYHFQDLTGEKSTSKAQVTPPVITVFSAPNYCGRYMNKAAFLRISKDLEVKSVRKRGLFSRKKKQQELELGVSVRPMQLVEPVQFTAVDAPDPIEIAAPPKDNPLNVERACPYMPTTFSAFIKKALELAGEGVELREVVKETSEEALSRGKGEEEKPPPVPPKLHGHAKSKPGNWKALQMLGLDDPGPETRKIGSGAEPRNRKKKGNKQHKEFQEAALHDSVMEMRPELIKGKVDAAVKKFEKDSIFENLPETIRLKEDAEAKRKANKRLSTARDGKEKITFTKEEITALQALFLLIDRKGVGKIDTSDLVNWSRDSGTAVHPEDGELCMRYVDYDNDQHIGFKDYLVFAGRCKEQWLKEQYTKVMTTLNEMRRASVTNK